MALTGEAVLIANSNKYGQNEGAPRGCAGDGTHLYVIGNNRKRLIRVTNLETFASEYASAAITGTIQSLAFLDGDAYFSAGTALHRIDAPLTDLSTPTALTGTLPSNIFSLASDGTHLYGYRQSDNTIHRITITSAQPTDTFTTASFTTVTFPPGVSTNIRSFFYLDGAFYFVNLSDNRLYKSPENVASGSTVSATQVGNFTNFGAGVQGVHGAGVLNDNAYFASGASDNLYRFYNVRWDAEIDAIEVDEGQNTSLDLSTVSQDATSFAFAPGRTARSWVTLSGNDIVITNAPAVTEDTDFEEVVRAVRGSVHEDKTLTVTVRDTTPKPPSAVPPQPSAPEQVEIKMTPTTAEVLWKAPTNGAVIDEYEVSTEEGSTPGTKWIATGSTETRAMVKELKRQTAYTFRVRARNAQGAGLESAAMTEMTPIASLNNCLFFKEFIHTGERVTVHGSPTEIVRTVVDNDDNTFSTETDYAIDISRDNQPTRVDAVFIKSKGITRHSGTPTGGSGTGWTNETLPETVENWEGTPISTTVLGFQHHLMLLDSHFTATSMRVQFEGTHVEIYEIMLLEFIMEIDANGDFVEINPDYVDRSAVIHTSPDGGIRRSAPLGAEKSKWETNFVVKVVPGKTVLESVDEFVYLMSENPNFVFSQEFSRYPARVYPASFLMTRVPTRLRGDNKNLGDVVQFRVGEQ